MKTNSLIPAPVQLDAALEALIEKKDIELKALARKNAMHFAARNRPDANDDTFSVYTGDLRTGYGKISADFFRYLQPTIHLPEGKMDIEFYREKDSVLTEEISRLDHENGTAKYELGDFHPGTIPAQIWIALIATLIIFSGEVLYNTKSFQLIVENLLFAFGLSFAISFAVMLSSHFAAFLYKEAKTRLKRRLIVIISLATISIVFTAIALLRSIYLAKHDVQLNPIYFVLFNLFLFIVAGLVSLFFLPTWQEIKDQLRHIKLYYGIKKRDREIKNLKAERERLKEIITELSKYRLRIVHYGDHGAATIHKMYHETIEIFKTTNLIHRRDHKTPDCFNQPVLEPDISDVPFTFTNSIKK
jgi:hypothetical protein